MRYLGLQIAVLTANPVRPIQMAGMQCRFTLNVSRDKVASGYNPKPAEKTRFKYAKRHVVSCQTTR